MDKVTLTVTKRIKQKLPKLQMRAEFMPSSINEEKRTISVTWTTGYKGLRRSAFGEFYEELSLEPTDVNMTLLKSGRAKFLASHDMSSLDSVLGVVESATIGSAHIRFSKDEISERNLQKIRDGILTDVSVGYMVDEYTDVSAEGDEVPTYRATKWTPIEVSLVPVGFDPGAVVRSETQTENEVEIITRSEESKETEHMSVKTQPVVEQVIVDTEALKKEAATAERNRALEIRTAVREAKLSEKMADEYIDRGTSIDEARSNIALFAKYAKEQEATKVVTATRVEIGTENAEATRKGFEEALLARVDAKNFKVTDDAKQFYGKSLLRQLEIMIPRYTMEADVAYAKRAMSSSDLPLALANVAEKGLQKMYDLQPRTFSQWSRSDTLNNYKEFSQVKTGDHASLLERTENAEAQESSFGEDKEVAQLKDYARIVSFSSQMLVNDDLGAISRIASAGGVAVSRLENRLAYAALTTNKTMNDGVALYHATHGNLGSAAAISTTTVAEAYKFMRKQASTDGLDKLNLTPRYFVCGPDKEVEARQFFAAINPVVTSAVNIFQGSMTVVVDAELTGNQYYFLADPSFIDTVVCYRLAGQEQPKIESRVKFENSSLQLKIDHAFAASMMDWRGVVKNAGN